MATGRVLRQAAPGGWRKGSRWWRTWTSWSSGPHRRWPMCPELLDEVRRPESGVRCAMFSSSPEAESFTDVMAHLGGGVAVGVGRRAGVPPAAACEVDPL
ncbi:hypothetical protein [Streptomyces sp. PSKA30]|uniref:hypothetical protein n=1 Tax=Streptomyces sp. PSKA30 TaxID=2874597 RepID=UPI001CD0C291|nr:hypothetical protein [Streptomyces sp. PSKA30]MBZ9642669.1 hypothetical protein [Streptomyces sp. PSKA30]